MENRKLEPFRAYCQKSLPAVYDDSLSYYELVCKLVNTLNNVISEVNRLDDSNETIIADFAKFKTWVETYLTNLDVQDEINKKLDELVTNGTLQSLVNNVFAALQTSINALEDDVEELQIGSVMKDGTEQVTWRNLSQDVKDKLVSGTPPTSAPNSINTSNIIDGAVKFAKLNNELAANIYGSQVTAYNTNEVGGYYSVGSNNKPEVVNTNVFNRAMIPIDGNKLSPNDTIIISRHLDYGLTPALFFTDENDDVIFKLPGTNALSRILTIPYNAKKVYFNSKVGNNYGGIVKIEGYSFKDTTIKPAHMQSIPLAFRSDGIYSMLNWGTEFSGYYGYAYKVEAGERIRIKGTRPSDIQFAPAIFVGDIKDSDISKAVCYIGALGKAEGAKYDLEGIVPTGAKYIIICNNTGTQSVYRYTFDSTAEDDSGQNVEINDGVITFNGGGTSVTFRRFGGNRLMMISSVTIGDKTINTNFTDMSPAPYIVNALANADGTRSFVGFTGGNHNYENTGEDNGHVTATLESYHVLVDEKEQIGNGKFYGNNLKLVMTNLVQANNTCKVTGDGRNVIKEKLVFQFDNGVINLTQTIECLEDVNIITYYGLQLAGFSANEYSIYADKYMYHCGANKYKLPTKPTAIAGEHNLSFIMKLYDGGLGDYKLNNGNSAFIADYGKAYYHMIDNQNFNRGDRLWFNGSYCFDKESTIA